MAGISRMRAVASQLIRCVSTGANKTRSYGCAAAQVQYDSDEEVYDQHHDDRRMFPTPVLDTEGAFSGRGVQWVILGEPCVKKHVYAERLSKLLEVPHISMGSLVRQELNPLSSLYKQISNAVNQGKLVPEDIIFGLLAKRLEEGHCRGETGFILDGIPRTRMQAEILDQIADVDLVINLQSNEEDLMNRHSGARTTSKVSTLNPLKPVSSASKHPLYAEQRKLLEEYYRKQQKLVDFKVAGPTGETWQGLLAALDLQHVGAVNPTNKLTA